MKSSKRSRPVAQIGLGIMGGAFARHLVTAGFDVLGFDVDRRRREEWRRFGGRIAACARLRRRNATC
ncbi:MAG: NAD(P)-dependent oxidoreductase [Burkholderiales bacterium]|nr:NAD(P)-dependent oxidoreductase [Burkholderiales bacterium]